MKRIVILASGNGSNFEAIVKKFRQWRLDIEITALITDNNWAYAIKRAEKLSVPVRIVNAKRFENKDSFNKNLFKLLKYFDPDLIALAGYMRILPSYIVKTFEGKIVNIHPSLLPAFPGLSAIGRAYRSGVKYTGITIHFVDEGVDTGTIIEQRALRIKDNETLNSLERRIHRLEHYHYPRVLKKLLTGQDKEGIINYKKRGGRK